MGNLEKLNILYKDLKKEIERRIEEFEYFNKKDTEIFAELCFCILTPQSKAKTCWIAIKSLMDKNLLLYGSEEEIKKELKNVRFKNKKTKYIIEARKKFFKNGRLIIKSMIKKFKNNKDLREFLVKNIKGLGWKEASHFLRNVGLGEDIAIIDRHILKNLKEFKIIKKIPKTITKGIYLKIEKNLSLYQKELVYHQ
ncbi:MAG: N-glycosylase/DNA lyase [bacterium]|nr:N-glycosylase/DNA lyase [bacterium]MDW8163341.1 N-glycosylase/DNA lyase [Candidatus Omnitrophota bacterium]